MGCVYFFKHNGIKPIKIGMSKHDFPSERFRQMKTYSPFGAKIIRVIKTNNPESLERDFHDIYDSKRLLGEWFDLSDEDLGFVLESESLIENWLKINGLIINKPIQNDYICTLIQRKTKVIIGNREILKEIFAYCKRKGFRIEKGRNHKGRYFIIKPNK